MQNRNLIQYYILASCFLCREFFTFITFRQGSGTVDGARFGGDERLTAAFAQADAPLFIR